MYICEFCEKFFNGIEPYTAHLNSEKHKKKAGKLTSSTPDAVMTAVPSVTTENSQNMHICEVCDKIFNGIQPYTDHLNSEKHKKKAMTLTTTTSPASVITAVPNVINGNSQNTYSCEACDKFFNGIQPFTAHLNSEKHKKKSGAITSSTPDAGITVLSNTSKEKLEDCIVPFGAAYKCITCDMPLNSPGQAETHVYGQKHKKMNNKAGGSAESSEPYDMNDLNKTLNDNDFGSKSSLINGINFNDVEMKEVMSDVKIFNVDDPIEF